MYRDETLDDQRAIELRVAVCGEVPADPLAVPILARLGVRELSVSPPAVAEVEEVVRDWATDEMRDLAAAALAASTAFFSAWIGGGSGPALIEPNAS